jgi:hypothetical protein
MYYDFKIATFGWYLLNTFYLIINKNSIVEEI